MAESVLPNLLPELQRALEQEVRAARKDGGERIRLSHGRFAGQSQHGWLYEFRADQEVRVPDDCGIEVQAGDDRVTGTVVTGQGFDVLLELDDRLSSPPRHALMFVRLWYILERLSERLETMAAQEREQGASIPLTAVGSYWPASAWSGRPVQRPSLNEDQSLAVDHSLGNPATFIWGPPGTGKTTVVGRLVFEGANRDLRVLVLAYSNAAVDVAMISVAEQFTSSGLDEPGRVLRLGTPRNREVTEHSWLTAEAVLRTSDPHLSARRDRLREQLRRREHPRGSSEHERLRGELAAVRQELKTRELGLAAQARVLGATLAKAATDRFFADFRADLVVLDEASMASIPFALMAAAMATRHFVAAGDFRQLPPVVLSDSDDAKQWLERHIFDHSGITNAVRRSLPDQRLVQLHVQHRMHSRISAIVSEAFYGGDLRDAPETEARASRIVEKPPNPGEAIVLVDTGRLLPWCRHVPPYLGRSRFNPVHALLAVLLVAASREKHGSIAVITPYRAQARLLRLLIDDLEWSETVQASTVHRFQGSEADMVVLDLTSAAPHKPLGPLLAGDAWSLPGRLLNVAISRARGKLVAVAQHRWLMETSLPGYAIRDVLRRLEADSGLRPITYEALARQLEKLNVSDRVMVTRDLVFGDLTGRRAVEAREICIGVSSQMPAPGWLHQAGARGARILVRGRDLDRSWRSIPTSRVDDVPSAVSACLIDRQELWLQLPVSSWSLRLRGKESAEYLGDLLGLVPDEERRLLVARGAVQEHGPLRMCHVCGGSVWIVEGRHGPEFGCLVASCGARRRLTVDTAAEYLGAMGVTCPECGALPKVSTSLFVRCSRAGCEWGRPFHAWMT